MFYNSLQRNYFSLNNKNIKQLLAQQNKKKEA
jgi:hypothetical protein